MQFNPGVAEWLLDHLIRPRQHIRRDRQADLLRGFQVDHELDLVGCSTGKSAGLAPLRILSPMWILRLRRLGVFVQSI